MAQFLCDSMMDTDYCSPELERNFCGMYNSSESDFDSLLNSALLDDSVHSVFNEIANIRPTSSSSSDEDDKNLIVSWELNERNLDTLPSSPLCHIKQETEDLIFSDSETGGPALSPTQSLCSISVIETPPVSPDVKPVTISSSAPVNLVLIDPTNSNVLPLRTVNGTRLVPVTTFRSQIKQNDSEKVPIISSRVKSNSSITDKLSKTKHSRLKVASPGGGCDTISLLLPKTETSSVMSSLSDCQIKALKRQQRMIKNRESASLSRKKKKEYVTYLEQRLEDLAKENRLLKEENRKLKDKVEEFEKVNRWHSPNKLFDKTKKVTAVFVVMFMISFNVGSLSNWSPRANDELTDEVIYKYSPNENHHSRSLLWADDGLHNSSQNFSNSENKYREHFFNEKCPLFINQTESLRLDSELRKWIDAYPIDNTTHSTTKGTGDFKPVPWPLSFSSPQKESKRPPKKRDPISPTYFRPKTAHDEMEMFDLNNNIFDVNEPLYQAMDRKQDTFYVVSFSGDHLLLPAVSQNQTLRPKMSLVLPSVTANGSLSSSDIITMMQIDCTVINTKLLHVKQKDIPAHFKTLPVKNLQKSNTSYFKEGVRRKFNPSYSLPINEKNYLDKNPV